MDGAFKAGRIGQTSRGENLALWAWKKSCYIRILISVISKDQKFRDLTDQLTANLNKVRDYFATRSFKRDAKSILKLLTIRQGGNSELGNEGVLGTLNTVRRLKKHSNQQMKSTDEVKVSGIGNMLGKSNDVVARLMPPFPFLVFPLEIRCLVYDLVLGLSQGTLLGHQ